MKPAVLEVLEYPAVLRWLADEAHSPPGAEAALAVRPDLGPEAALARWRLIDEARSVLAGREGPDLRDHCDLSELLRRLAPEGARLDPAGLALAGLEAQSSTWAKAWLDALGDNAPLLAGAGAGLADFSDFTAALARTLGPDGEILDSASPRLARLRSELGGARQALGLKLGELMRSEEYRGVLMDELVTTRNDRYVVPVRASAAGRRRGLVHDWSNSGATAYLEPLETVEDNNRLALIKREEAREIERILAALSDECRAMAPDLAAAGAAMTRLDLALAMARLAASWEAHTPERVPGGGLELIRARHPLLERRLRAAGRTMVPLDISLGPAAPMMVISGLNAGGKTVALRTLGLLSALALSGLPLPVDPGSRLDFPRDVLTIMGDNQDLEQDLSTFSGHVKALGEVLEAAGPGILVIVDELGSGTDPAEGAALGLAVLERLRPSGALVAAATHFHLIKSWAALADGVASVSVNLSPGGQPVYGLSYGAPGFSGGLRMARRLGLPADLVDRAESYLDDGHRRAMELLGRLDEERGALAEERRALAALRLDLAERARLEAEERSREIAAITRQAREQAAAVKSQLARNRADFERLKEDFRAQAATARGPDLVELSLRRARQERELEAVKPSVAEPGEGASLREPAVGVRARIGSLGLEGVITRLNPGRGECVVEAESPRGAMTVTAAIGDLLEPSARKGRGPGGPPRVSLVAAEDEAALSLNLIGRTVEEARDIIDKEIDRAMIGGRGKMTIIHGLGTGRLKRGVAEHLRRHPRVKGFFNPLDIPGGAGITEVELRS
jgi:DNA mismatch repair protein MutS2